MKHIIITIVVIFCTTLAFAQTIQQIQLLQDRISADQATILQDQKDMNTETETYNRVMTAKQNDIDTLTTEIQGAQEFLQEMNANQQINSSNWNDVNLIQQ